MPWHQSRLLQHNDIAADTADDDAADDTDDTADDDTAADDDGDNCGERRESARITVQLPRYRECR